MIGRGLLCAESGHAALRNSASIARIGNGPVDNTLQSVLHCLGGGGGGGGGDEQPRKRAISSLVCCSSGHYSWNSAEVRSWVNVHMSYIIRIWDRAKL